MIEKKQKFHRHRCRKKAGPATKQKNHNNKRKKNTGKRKNGTPAGTSRKGRSSARNPVTQRVQGETGAREQWWRSVTLWQLVLVWVRLANEFLHREK